MEHCTNCGAELLPQTRFCGRCGQVKTVVNPSSPADIQSRYIPVSSPTPIMPSSQATSTVYPPTQISEQAKREAAPRENLRDWMEPASGSERKHIDDEEEQRRKGMLVPPFPPGVGSTPQIGQAPQASGVAQMGGAPVVQGTPQVRSPDVPPHLANQPPQSYPPHLINHPAQSYPPHLANQPAQGYPANAPNQPVQSYPQQGGAQHMQAASHHAQHMMNHPASQIGKAVNRPRVPGLKTVTSKIVAGTVATVVVVAVVLVATMHKNTPAGPGGSAAFYSVSGQGGISAVGFNGTSLWTFTQSGVTLSAPVEAQGIVYTVGRPAVQGQKVNGALAAQQAGTLYAVRAGDGSTLWSTPLDDAAGPPTPYKDGVYVEVGMYVEAFQASNGHMSWKAPTDGGDEHPVDAVTETAVYSLGDASSGLDCLYALNRSDGKLLWRYQGGLFNNVIVDQGSLYMTDAQGVASGGGGSGGANQPITPCPTNTSIDRTTSHVYSLNASTGALNWTFSEGATYSPPQMKLANGTLYLATPVSGSLGATASSTHIVALQTSNGTKIWDFNAGDHGFPGYMSYDLSIQNGIVCFASYMSKAVFGLKASDGAQLWKFATNQAGVNPIAVANGMVYVETLEASAVYLNALQASDGKVLWKVPNPNMIPYASASQGAVPVQPTVQYQLVDGAIYKSGVTTTGQSVTYPLVRSDGSLVMAST